MYKVDSPLSVNLSKTRKWALNLGKYRNAHYHILSDAKVAFRSELAPQIEELPFFNNPIELTYVVYFGSKRRFDLDNVITVIHKFFCDCLTHFNKIEDDNYKHIPRIIYEFGGIDKNYPRCEIYIEELKNEIINYK